MIQFNQMKSRLQSSRSKNPFKVVYPDTAYPETQVTQEESSTLQSARSISSQDSSQLYSPPPKSSSSPRKSTTYRAYTGVRDFNFNDTFDLTPSKPKKTIQFEGSSKTPQSKKFALNELETCKSEISQLKTEIQKIKSSSSKAKKKQFAFISYKELNFRLQQQRHDLEKQHRLVLSRQKSELFKEFQTHFESFHGKFVDRVKARQADFIRDKGKEIEEIFAYELLVIENQLGEKLEKDVKKLTDKFEGLNERLVNENSELKKQVHELKGLVRQTREKCENFECDGVRCISQRYKKLQNEFEESKRTEKSVLCEKCLAFTEVDINLSKRLTSLKDYLDFED